MKLRIEIDPDLPEEVVLRGPQVSQTLRRVQDAVSRALSGGAEIAVQNGEEECYLPYDEILFAETADNRLWVHTCADCYSCPLRLYELEELLPRTFARASKGSLINTAKIRSLSRSPTGVGEATFRDSKKRIFISRMYFKNVRDIIEETRLQK